MIGCIQLLLGSLIHVVGYFLGKHFVSPVLIDIRPVGDVVGLDGVEYDLQVAQAPIDNDSRTGSLAHACDSST